MEPYEKLANAIVLQAVQDYRTKVKKLKKFMAKKPGCDAEKEELDEKKKDVLREMQSIRRFFYSRWFEMLTNLDGDAIVQRLEKEANI